MTIPDSLRMSLEAIPTGRGDAPPPVNNACMPDQFNKLDANAIEKTRVLNALLTIKLQVQEKVLQKYKTAAERSYAREKCKVKSDLKNIGKRLPNYADIPNLETKIKRMKKRRRTNNGPVHNCVFTTEPIGIKGISTEKDDRPFCGRYIHHHIPTKGKMYKQILPAVKDGMRNIDFRPRPRPIALPYHHPLQHSRDVETFVDREMSREKVIPPIHALDDNFMVSKSHLKDDDDDDWKTV